MDTATPPKAPTPSHSPNTGMAILSYIGILVIIPLISDAKNDPFVKFHAKQGLVLLIVWVIAGLFWSVPFFGPLFGWLLWLASFVLMILGIVAAANHEMKELPVIGQFAKHFNF